MHAMVYVNVDGPSIVPGTPVEVLDLIDLEKRCAQLLKREGTIEVWGYSISGSLLFHGVKSKKQKPDEQSR